MRALERAMDERSADLSSALTHIGFSDEEARRFLAKVRPELIRSYQWQAEAVDVGSRGPGVSASDVLSGIRARALATEVGISDEQAWAALRELVPAVLEDASRPRKARAAGADDAVARFEVGFGLTLERLRARREGVDSSESDGDAPIGARHPIFGHLLAGE